MNSEYEKCRHPECDKMVLNVSGFCLKHRERKCFARGCNVMISGKQDGKYCEKHKQSLHRRQDSQAWTGGIV